jgi:Mn2+/Fe2+ NRAMP family transporter
MNLSKVFKIVAPGLLVAATGVGAGDLITAGLAGKYLGLAVLWAPIFGAILKWTLNEGLVRWQMSTGTTLLEGWIQKLGKWIEWLFVVYLIFWSFMVGGALVNACGIAGSSFFMIHDPVTSKVVWGVAHSLLGIFLVKRGSFELFEKIMSAFILVMFVVVVVTAIMLRPDLSEVMSGMFIPRIEVKQLGWIMGVLGGVGGTLTMLSYGYWVRESGRKGAEGLKICRLDLLVSYTVTAFFSIAMIIIGSKLDLSMASKGNFSLIVANQLGDLLGSFGKYAFMIGFWGGVFSSLLGVWQSVPYLFTDYMSLKGKVSSSADFSKTSYYSKYLYFIAFVPLISLFMNFESIQLAYAVLGAFFMPLLAVSLLILNNKREYVHEFKNGFISNSILIITLVFFTYTGISKIIKIAGL